MTSDRITKYIDDLTRALRGDGAFDATVVDEVRDHLSDAIEDGIRRGLPADAAEREAIARCGPPDVVAAHVAAGVPRVRRRALLALCAATVLASTYLSLSMFILRPPRANYSVWTIEAALFAVQGALTIAALVRGGSPSTWSRALLIAGSVVLVVVGVSALSAAATSHFEGYGVLLGAMLTMQGVLTIEHFVRRRIHRAVESMK